MSPGSAWHAPPGLAVGKELSAHSKSCASGVRCLYYYAVHNAVHASCVLGVSNINRYVCAQKMHRPVSRLAGLQLPA